MLIQRKDAADKVVGSTSSHQCDNVCSHFHIQSTRSTRTRWVGDSSPEIVSLAAHSKAVKCKLGLLSHQHVNVVHFRRIQACSESSQTTPSGARKIHDSAREMLSYRQLGRPNTSIACAYLCRFKDVQGSFTSLSILFWHRSRKLRSPSATAPKVRPS